MNRRGWVQHAVLVAGVDEAGRGPLAGPVFAAAVVLDPTRPVAGLGDSKTLSERQRARLAGLVRRQALSWAVAWADVAEIDSLNILQASLLAMRRAVERLHLLPAHVQVDGAMVPGLDRVGPGCSAEAVVRGDASVAAISAASILAKVHRDDEMRRLDELFPVYGFAGHKGYPTRRHLDALASYGPSSVHRMSFAPVKAARRPAVRAT